jgi:hypothetical protein
MERHGLERRLGCNFLLGGWLLQNAAAGRVANAMSAATACSPAPSKKATVACGERVEVRPFQEDPV